MTRLPLRLLPLALFPLFVATSQPRIAAIPRDISAGAVTTNDLVVAFNKLHLYSETIYNPIRITMLDSTGWQPENLSDPRNTDRWGEGAWGRGHFSRLVDRHLFLKNTTEYWTVWHINEGFKQYWGTHPSIDYCARMVVAYIHRYAVVQNPVFKNRVIPGLDFLVRQQRPSGGYVQWHWRPGRSQPNLNDELSEGNLENSYSTAEAIRAMVEGHAFLLRYAPADTARMSRLRVAVRKAGEFLLQHSDASYPRNYVGFSIWGLASAFRVARDVRFRERAAEKFRTELCAYQDENGAWFNGPTTSRDYHDAHPCYSGIIMRGMAELYNILPASGEGPLRDSLRTGIVKTINHFLSAGMDKGRGVRLKNNGMLAPYGKESEYVGGPYLASTLVDGLTYALKGEGILTEQTDRDNTRKFLNAIVRAHVADTMNRFLLDPNVDANIELLALYGDL